MLATSRAAGRVMKIERRGGDLAVTLGPMQLGEVLRDADITLDQPINLADMTVQAVPALPYMYRDFAAPADATPMDKLPAAGKSMGKASVGTWEMELAAKTDNPDNANGGGKFKERITLKIQGNPGD